MRLSEIEQKVLSGELRLEKDYIGKRRRRKYIWNEDSTKIIEVKTIIYDAYVCRAMIDYSRGYRISKKVFESLMKQLSK